MATFLLNLPWLLCGARCRSLFVTCRGPVALVGMNGAIALNHTVIPYGEVR